MCFFVQVKWVTSEDRGPNGASGKAKFKPSFSVGLVVTLYKVYTQYSCPILLLCASLIGRCVECSENSILIFQFYGSLIHA